MARKQMYECGTKEKIMEVATEVFFRKGYDKTNLRDISDGVHCEVGLCYYYYNSKEDLFARVMENFFRPYEEGFERYAQKVKAHPEKAIFMFFEYLRRATKDFRAKYNSINPTIRVLIRERTLSVIEPYITSIIEDMKANGAKPVMSTSPMAVFLTHGAGSIILHESEEWVDSSLTEVKKTVAMIMGIDVPEEKQI